MVNENFLIWLTNNILVEVYTVFSVTLVFLLHFINFLLYKWFLNNGKLYILICAMRNNLLPVELLW